MTEKKPPSRRRGVPRRSTSVEVVPVDAVPRLPTNLPDAVRAAVADAGSGLRAMDGPAIALLLQLAEERDDVVAAVQAGRAKRADLRFLDKDMLDLLRELGLTLKQRVTLGVSVAQAESTLERLRADREKRRGR
jgi:hypothetical protein